MAIVQRGKGGFSSRGRPWIRATSQCRFATVSSASAAARCSRLPQRSSAPRKPRNTTPASTARRTSGPRRRAQRLAAIVDIVPSLSPIPLGPESSPEPASRHPTTCRPASGRGRPDNIPDAPSRQDGPHRRVPGQSELTGPRTFGYTPWVIRGRRPQRVPIGDPSRERPSIRTHPLPRRVPDRSSRPGRDLSPSGRLSETRMSWSPRGAAGSGTSRSPAPLPGSISGARRPPNSPVLWTSKAAKGRREMRPRTRPWP